MLDLPNAEDLTGEDMPPIKEYMKRTQKNGEKLHAEEIYQETWEWLRRFSCEHFIGTQLLNQYAMSVSRWIQCEEAISEFGFLAKHPTTGQAI
ncbi:MAG: terminase, partial [Tissierellia bacterium]|nr:terminase [Tissierellia bacterium]